MVFGVGFNILTFDRQTGVPVMLNTSFNENEPVVRLRAAKRPCGDGEIAFFLQVCKI